MYGVVMVCFLFLFSFFLLMACLTSRSTSRMFGSVMHSFFLGTSIAVEKRFVKVKPVFTASNVQNILFKNYV